MSQLKESKVNQVTGRSRHSPRRLEFERTRGKGWHEPYESRGSRTDLWGAGAGLPGGLSVLSKRGRDLGSLKELGRFHEFCLWLKGGIPFVTGRAAESRKLDAGPAICPKNWNPGGPEI